MRVHTLLDIALEHLSQMKLPNSNFKAAFKLPGANTCATLQRVERLPSLRKTPSPFFTTCSFYIAGRGPSLNLALQLSCFAGSTHLDLKEGETNGHPIQCH
jgi:hypothetical protein